MQCHYHSDRQATVIHTATGQALCDSCNGKKRYYETIERLLLHLYRLHQTNPETVYDLMIDRDGNTPVYPSSLWQICGGQADPRLFSDALLFLLKSRLVTAHLETWPLGKQIKTLRNIRLTPEGIQAGANLAKHQAVREESPLDGP